MKNQLNDKLVNKEAISPDFKTNDSINLKGENHLGIKSDIKETNNKNNSIGNNSSGNNRKSDFYKIYNYEKLKRPISQDELNSFKNKIDEFLTKINKKQNYNLLFYSKLEIFRSIFYIEKFKNKKITQKINFYYSVEN